MNAILVPFIMMVTQGDVTQNPYTPNEEPPIAYFDVVPQQYVTGVFDMGVVAYHLEEIDRVEYTVVREGYIGDWNADDIVDGQDLGVLIERWNQGVSGRELGELLSVWGQSVPHQPETFTVTEQTMNSRTGELEYWFSLDTRKDPDTKITVTAEVFPVDGPSLVLDQNIEDILGDGYTSRPGIQWTGVNLFSNNTGRWNVGQPIYMSPDGNDATADGTMEKPFANFMPALRHAEGDDDPYMNVQGRRIYMLPGTYVLDGSYCDTAWWACSTDRDETRFLSVSPAPGYGRGDVVLTNSNLEGDRLSIGRAIVHFKDIEFVSASEHWLTPGNTIRWYENCTISGDADEWWKSNYVRSSQPHYGYQYYTDCTQQYQAEGNAGIIMRNMLMDHIHCDVLEKHWIQMALSIMITNHNVGVENPNGCHIDYIQINGGFPYMIQNRIMRDVFGNHSCLQQGVHACPGEGNGIGIRDSAWINVELSNTGGLDQPRCNISALIFRWCGPGQNNLFRGCMFHGKPTDDGHPGNLHSTVSYIRNFADGTRNEEGPWVITDEGLPRFKNVKFEDCWNDWDRTIPLFLKPDAGEPWVFYGPDELQFDSDTRDGFNDNPFGPNDPWWSPITGIMYTQTE